jgi:multidrug efflux pump subunit AcrB
VILALSLVVVFLFLAAQYESWSLPFAILLVVPLAFVGALWRAGDRRPRQRHLLPDRLVTLIGLASKNSILIVEFAKAAPRGGPLARRRGARGRRDPAAPVVMTAFAFISGRAAARDRARRGRRGAALARHDRVRRDARGHLLSLVLVPALFVIVQGAAEWVGRRLRGAPRTEERANEARARDLGRSRCCSRRSRSAAAAASRAVRRRPR